MKEGRAQAEKGVAVFPETHRTTSFSGLVSVLQRLPFGGIIPPLSIGGDSRLDHRLEGSSHPRPRRLPALFIVLRVIAGEVKQPSTASVTPRQELC